MRMNPIAVELTDEIGEDTGRASLQEQKLIRDNLDLLKKKQFVPKPGEFALFGPLSFVGGNLEDRYLAFDIEKDIDHMWGGLAAGLVALAIWVSLSWTFEGYHSELLGIGITFFVLLILSGVLFCEEILGFKIRWAPFFRSRHRVYGNCVQIWMVLATVIFAVVKAFMAFAQKDHSLVFSLGPAIAAQLVLLCVICRLSRLAYAVLSACLLGIFFVSFFICEASLRSTLSTQAASLVTLAAVGFTGCFLTSRDRRRVWLADEWNKLLEASESQAKELVMEAEIEAVEANALRKSTAGV